MTLAELQELIVQVIAVSVLLGLFTGVMVSLFGKK